MSSAKVFGYFLRPEDFLVLVFLAFAILELRRGVERSSFSLAFTFPILNLQLRSLQPLFTKLAKSHISAQFLVRMFVLGWYTYFETAQVLFSLCFRETGVKTPKIYE